MKLTDEERESLVRNRVLRAFDTLEELKGIVGGGYWYAAANRMYYACFYISTALLIKHGYHSSTHSGVIRLLGFHFVSTGIISKDMGKLYSQVYELRQSGDYDDWKVVEEKDILPLLPQVEEFIQTVYHLIQNS